MTRTIRSRITPRRIALRGAAVSSCSDDPCAALHPFGTTHDRRRRLYGELVSSAPEHTGHDVPAPYAAYIPPALENVSVPAYIVDRQGRIRWLNAAAQAITGDVVGRMFTAVIDPDEAMWARQVFERNVRGAAHRDQTVDLVRADGTAARVELSSTTLGPEGHAVGMFGLAIPQKPRERAAPRRDRRLTPRQQEILTLLADGASTDHIATQLHLSRETVRNHVRHILQRLGSARGSRPSRSRTATS